MEYSAVALILEKAINDDIVFNSKLRVKYLGQGIFSLFFRADAGDFEKTLFRIEQVKEITLESARIRFTDERKLWI